MESMTEEQLIRLDAKRRKEQYGCETPESHNYDCPCERPAPEALDTELVTCAGPGCTRQVKAYLKTCCVACSNRLGGRFVDSPPQRQHTLLCNLENA